MYIQSVAPSFSYSHIYRFLGAGRYRLQYKRPHFLGMGAYTESDAPKTGQATRDYKGVSQIKSPRLINAGDISCYTRFWRCDKILMLFCITGWDKLSINQVWLYFMHGL